ncbi:MAG: glucosyl-3-phosphoglycerate synthase [Chloroflexota bacterium]
MNKRKLIKTFRRIFVPVVHGCDASSAIRAAKLIAGEATPIYLIGLIHISEGETLSSGALPARSLRKEMNHFTEDEHIHVRARVIVSAQIFNELRLLVMEEKADLIILDKCAMDNPLFQSGDFLANPPCNLAIVRGHISEVPLHLLAPLRGGPYAELALRLCLVMGRNTGAEIKALHMTTPPAPPEKDAAFRGIRQVLASLPEVSLEEYQVQDPVETILNCAQGADIIIMGTTAQKDVSAIGPVVERIYKNYSKGVIVVKNTVPVPAKWESQAVGQSAISVLVDKWFAENTYHADEFSDLEKLVALKKQQKLTIGVALPALNEEETVEKVIKTIKTALMDEVPLLDEMVLIDSNSTDRTREIAADLGIPVFIHQQILPQYGVRHGKGEALWKSLFVTHSDILIWIDTDIVNIYPDFVYGLIGPLLIDPDVQFVKGFYRRPIKVDDKLQAGGGGRVTELTARPLINLFYPELSGIIQPLAGEYGGRRSVLEKLPFFSGYGVEIGLLIGMFEMFGINAIAQIDLRERIHRNQSLQALSKMSFAIIQTVIRKLEARYQYHFLEDVNKTMKLIQHESGRFFLDVQEIAEQERLPMITLPEYLER